MKNRTEKFFVLLLALTALTSCVENQKNAVTEVETNEVVENEPHRYGGWYCPDNLNGLPAVDIAHWKNVPVVNDRLPTEEETRNGSSLILVDREKYPDAKALGIQLPKLAYFYNLNVQRMDLVIVIQAITVDQDSIVGFRYLNGGNGSARLSEVDFLSDEEIQNLPNYRFVTQRILINANKKIIWNTMISPNYTEVLQKTFDPSSTLASDWREHTDLNFYYANAGQPTAQYADELFGNQYIQNDYKEGHYTEKFLLIEDRETGLTTLQIVCGPFLTDFEQEKNRIIQWSEKVKELSESIED